MGTARCGIVWKSSGCRHGVVFLAGTYRRHKEVAVVSIGGGEIHGENTC